MNQTSSNSSFEFTAEQLKLLHNNGGEPLHVPVKETNKVYLVIEEGVIPTLDEDYMRRGLAHAAEQVERGEVADWDMEEIKAAGRALLAQQRQRP
jgi:hypothetical protein